MHRNVTPLAAFISVLIASSAHVAKPSPVPSPLEPIVFLAGGTWRGDLPPGPNGAKMSIELTADWAANHQAVRFDSSFVMDGKRAPYTSGLYCWSPSKKQLVFLYSDMEGSLTEGAVTLENGGLRHEFTVTDAQGKVDHARAIITPRGADAYTNEIFTSIDGKWERKVEVRYVRVPSEARASAKP